MDLLIMRVTMIGRAPKNPATSMITRVWHGYTKPQDADSYHQLLLTTILPGIHRIAGYKGSNVLRRNCGDEVEFIALTFWESLDAIREFAGPDYERSVILPEAAKLLTRHDERSVHYDSVRSE
jgi:antibiotic biosynthesis monooxygenase (ABM) superfamily enzyme